MKDIPRSTRGAMVAALKDMLADNRKTSVLSKAKIIRLAPKEIILQIK